MSFIRSSKCIWWIIDVTFAIRMFYLCVNKALRSQLRQTPGNVDSCVNSFCRFLSDSHTKQQIHCCSWLHVENKQNQIISRAHSRTQTMKLRWIYWQNFSCAIDWWCESSSFFCLHKIFHRKKSTSSIWAKAKCEVRRRITCSSVYLKWFQFVQRRVVSRECKFMRSTTIHVVRVDVCQFHLLLISRSLYLPLYFNALDFISDDVNTRHVNASGNHFIFNRAVLVLRVLIVCKTRKITFAKVEKNIQQ